MNHEVSSSSSGDRGLALSFAPPKDNPLLPTRYGFQPANAMMASPKGGRPMHLGCRCISVHNEGAHSPGRDWASWR